MSRKLLFWKNKQIKLPQIDSVSNIITKNINQRSLPDFLCLIQLIGKVQFHRLRKSRTTKSPIIMEQETTSTTAVTTTSRAKKRPLDDESQRNETSIQKKSKSNGNKNKNNSENMEIEETDLPTTSLLNDFFSKFHQIIQIIINNYKYSTNRILSYFHEVLKVSLFV